MSNVSQFKTPEGAAQYAAAYDAALKLWPVPHQALDVTTSFGTTHINAVGSMELPPLILLHSFGFSSTQWYPNVAPLSSQFRVYMPDVINQAGKSVATRPLQTRTACSNWLIEVLDALKIEQALIVGHSYGGWMTLNLAMAHPQRVERMVLLSPAASFAPLVWQFYVRGLITSLIPTQPLIYRMFQWMTVTPLAKDHPVVQQAVLGIKYLRMQQLMPPTVYTNDELSQIRIPTLLLIGEREVIYNKKPGVVIEHATRLIPHIQAELIAGGGHAFPQDQAECTNARILEFLNKR